MSNRFVLAACLCVVAITFGPLRAAQSPAVDPFGPANPVDPQSLEASLSTVVPDMHGTFSVENFQGTQANLRYTHESADGFRNYLSQFYRPNFAYRDGVVGTWAFHDIYGGDNYDLWSNGGIDYGIDAVRVCWHSSHGATDSNGLFRTSMGSNWYGRGWTAYSNKMTLGGNAHHFGDERLRYMFWDTCQSVKTTGGLNPLRTWGPDAKGIRMIFGYDNNSIDSPNYGTYFWQEWNKGKSFARAFLDASWRISQAQSPAVVAFGATVSEAVNRRDTERLFASTPVGSSTAAWTWYTSRSLNALTSGGASAPEVPGQIRVFEPAAGNSGDERVKGILGVFTAQSLDNVALVDRPFNLRVVGRDDMTLVVEPDGDWEVTFLRPEASYHPAGASENALIDAAADLIEHSGLAGGVSYRLGDVRYMNVSESSDGVSAPADRVAETTIVFEELLDGLPFVDPDAGHIEVTFDNLTNAPARLRSTLRQPTSAFGDGLEKLESRTLDDLRTAALAQVANHDRTNHLTIVPGTEKVGYSVVDGMLKPVYRVLFTSSIDPDSRLVEAVVPLGEAATDGHPRHGAPTPRPGR